MAGLTFTVAPEYYATLTLENLLLAIVPPGPPTPPGPPSGGGAGLGLQPPLEQPFLDIGQGQVQAQSAEHLRQLITSARASKPWLSYFQRLFAAVSSGVIPGAGGGAGSAGGSNIITVVAPSIDDTDAQWFGLGSIAASTDPVTFTPTSFNSASRFGRQFAVGDYIIWNDPGAWEIDKITKIDTGTGAWTLQRTPTGGKATLAQFGSSKVVHSNKFFYRCVFGTWLLSINGALAAQIQNILWANMTVAAVQVSQAGSSSAITVNLAPPNNARNTPPCPGMRTMNGAAYMDMGIVGAGGGASGTAVLSGSGLGSVTINTGGGGFLAPPLVVITGDGTGAAAHSVLTNGIVTSVVVDAAGSGYTTISITFKSVLSIGQSLSYRVRPQAWESFRTMYGYLRNPSTNMSGTGVAMIAYMVYISPDLVHAAVMDKLQWNSGDVNSYSSVAGGAAGAPDGRQMPYHDGWTAPVILGQTLPDYPPTLMPLLTNPFDANGNLQLPITFDVTNHLQFSPDGWIDVILSQVGDDNPGADLLFVAQT